MPPLTNLHVVSVAQKLAEPRVTVAFGRAGWFQDALRRLLDLQRETVERTELIHRLSLPGWGREGLRLRQRRLNSLVGHLQTAILRDVGRRETGGVAVGPSMNWHELGHRQLALVARRLVVASVGRVEDARLALGDAVLGV